MKPAFIKLVHLETAKCFTKLNFFKCNNNLAFDTKDSEPNAMEFLSHLSLSYNRPDES